MIVGDWIWSSKRRGEDLYLDTSFPNWGGLWVNRECLIELCEGIVQCCMDGKKFGGQDLCGPLNMDLGMLQRMFMLYSLKYDLEIGREEQ